MNGHIHESAQHWKAIALGLQAELERLETKLAESEQALTPKEIEVLKLTAHGLTSQQIADRMVISERTVRTHRTNIYSKLSVSNSIQAALYALHADLVSLDDAWESVAAMQGLRTQENP
jgi:two-component system, NarL family, response regulator LiaR